MASKSREREAQERLIDLRLRASIASTGYQEVGEYGLSPEGIERQKNQREFDALRALEAAEAEVQRKADPYFAQTAATWSKPVPELMQMKKYAGALLLDVAGSLPLTDKPIDSAKAQSTYSDFVALMQSKNQVLSLAGQQKLILYMGVNSESVHVSNGTEFSVAVDTLTCWVRALDRLLDLGAFGDEYAALEDEPQSEPDQTADDLKAAAEDEWSKFPLWHAWEESLSTGFGIKLTDRIKRIVCDEFVRANLSPYVAESFNEVRRRLVAREIFPARPDGEPALTLDERMSAATENYNFNDPRQKAAWAHEMGRLKAILS
jgi:hypothetical protein